MRRDLVFRVFVSSTFSDLIAERNALQKTVWPELRRYCQERKARFQAIDLRWGVSEEAALDQQTMPICLEELKRCQTVSPRPNFIVVLGDRYGWRPLPATVDATEFEALRAQIPQSQRAPLDTWYERDDNAVPAEYYLRPRAFQDDAAAREAEAEQWKATEPRLHELLCAAAHVVFPDPADPRRRKYEESATHQEIRHGALEAEDAAHHVYCYFRQLTGMPEDDRAKDDRDINPGSVDHAVQNRLHALKTELESIFPELEQEQHVYTYATFWNGGNPQSDLKALCDRVEQDLKTIIDAELAAFEETPELQREIDAHKEFGLQRSEHFMGRNDVLEQIGNYVSSPNRHPLVVCGVSGSGKTAVMAEAAERIATNRRPGTTILTRFIGATPTSSEIRSLLASLCQQMAGIDNDPLPVPTAWNALRQDFRRRLTRATAERPMVILLDALDQLGTMDGARELEWLPEELPEHVKLIVSVMEADGTEGECSRTTQKRAPTATRVEVSPLAKKDGDALLQTWLDHAHRTLQPDQRQEMQTKFSENGLPLYLKLAFGEARRWKSKEVPKALGNDVPGLVNGMLDRLEDSRHHGVVLTSRALGSLAAARRGLTEEEMLGVLSTDGVLSAVKSVLTDFEKRSPKSPEVTELPVVVWSRLHAEIQPYLIERQAGATAVMAFYHRQVGEAVSERYRTDDNSAHLRLAEYFGEPPFSERSVDELPWQLARAEDWLGLKILLGDLGFLNAAWTLNELDVKAYWAQIEAMSAYRMVATYRRVLAALPDQADSIWNLGTLLYDTGHLDECLQVRQRLVEQHRRSGDQNSLQISLGNQAAILQVRGNLDGAMALHKEEERICRELRNMGGLQRSLGNQAVILKTRGDLDGAMALHKEQEGICRALGNVDGLESSLGNQATILYKRGDLDGSMELFREQERMCRELRDMDSLQRSLGNQAVILNARRDLDGAIALHKEQERICREFGNVDGLQQSLGGQALILQARGDLDGAMALYREQERICRELGTVDGLAISLTNQAVLLAGRSPQAVELANEALRLLTERGLTALAHQVEPLLRRVRSKAGTVK